MFYVYILFSEKDRRLYTGYSDNLRSRFIAHTKGFVKATRYRRSLILIYYEAYLSESDARKREKFFKGGNGRKEMKIQLGDIFEKLWYTG